MARIVVKPVSLTDVEGAEPENRADMAMCAVCAECSKWSGLGSFVSIKNLIKNVNGFIS
jgi:hypothetical protein